MNNQESFCTFRVGDLHFGIEVKRVQEIIRHQKMTSVPLAPNIVRGLMNLRGQIVPAIDLRLRLNLPAREDETESINVVIRANDEPVSLLVDEIGDVVRVDFSDYELPPETLQGETRELIRGTFKLESGLLMILDTDRILAVAA